jgi:hypothetical protein
VSTTSSTKSIDDVLWVRWDRYALWTVSDSLATEAPKSGIASDDYTEIHLAEIAIHGDDEAVTTFL